MKGLDTLYIFDGIPSSPGLPSLRLVIVFAISSLSVGFKKRLTLYVPFIYDMGSVVDFGIF